MWVSDRHPDRDRLLAPRRAPEGTVLCALPRGRGEVLRVSLDEYEGHPFVSLRVFAEGQDGQLWPTKKGVSVRVRELKDVALALGEAYRLTGQDAARPRRDAPARGRGQGPAPATRPSGRRAADRPDWRQQELPGPAAGTGEDFDEFGG